MKKFLYTMLALCLLQPVFSQTYTNTTDYAIPDYSIIFGVGEVYSDIIVSGTSPLAVCSEVSFNISHTYDSDLDIYIVDPLNNETLLATAVGGGGDNFITTHFTMTAPMSIASGAAPFNGYFLPQNSAALPTGVDPNGTWRLHVQDWSGGDTGTILDWSITFSAPQCPTVGFHYRPYSATLIPPTVNCTEDTLIFFAQDSAVCNGAIYPALYFEFNTHANGTLNGAIVYEDGSPIWSDASLDANTQLTVYPTGPFCWPLSEYTINVCNNGGTAPMEWVVYDGNGTTDATGTTPSGCTTYGHWHPAGLATWSVAPAAPGFQTSDWGVSVFNPATVTPGTYAITYNWNNQGAGAYNCTGSQTQNITVLNPWVATWNSPGTVCASSGTFSLTPFVTGNAGGTWSGTGVSGTNFNPAGLSGAYNVTYTVGSSTTCRSSVMHQITVTPLATANAGLDHSICSGQSWTIAGASYGGSATSILWTTPGTGTLTGSTTTTPTYTPSAADIAAGSVVLTLTASGSCAGASDAMTIFITATDNANFTYSSATFCVTGSDPSPTIAVPGSGNFTSTPGGLSINTSSGLIDLSASTTGVSYTVTYTTTGTCPNSSSTSILITSGFDASFTYSGPYCQGGSGATPTFTTGSAGTFSSTPAGLVFVNVNTGEIDLSTSSPGTYSVTNDIPASGGCAGASSSFSVTISQQPIVSAGGDANVCESDSYTLAGSFGGSASSITWTTSGDGTFSNDTSTTSTYTPGNGDIITGSVTLTITTDDPAGSCNSSNDQITLTIFDAAQVSAGNDIPACSGDIVNISATVSGGASTGTWSSSGTGGFGDVTALTTTYTPSAADITAGTVTLTITSSDPSGPCNPISDILIITITNPPTAIAGPDGAICAGETYTLAGSSVGATSINWSSTGVGTFDNAGLPAATYTPSAADITSGSVTLVITTNDPAGPCTAASDSMTLTINPVPVISSVVTTPVSTCSTPNATIVITATGTGALTYSIDNGGTFTSSSTYSGLGVDNYFIVVHSSDGCENDTMVVIGNIPGLGPVIDSVEVRPIMCYGDTGEIVVYSADAILYSVEGGSNLQPDSLFTGLSTGINYTIYVEDTFQCGVTWPQPVLLTGPAAAVSADTTLLPTTCYGYSTGLISAIPSGGTGPYSYLWNSGQNTATITNLTAGTYSVTIKDNNNCSYVLDSIYLTQPSAINITITPTNPKCGSTDDGKAVAIVTGGTPGYTYIWSDGSTSATDSTLGEGTYMVTVSDVNFCSSIQAVNLVAPEVLIDTALVSIDNSTKVGAIDLVVIGGVPPYIYHWSNGSTTQDIGGLSSGDYIVTIVDGNDCITIDTFTVDLPLIIPDVITPNGDGINDDFQIQNIEAFPKVAIEIYGRWGDLLFKFDGDGRDYSDPANRWNGTFNGKDLPMGSYMYIVKLSGDEEPVTGAISIVR